MSSPNIPIKADFCPFCKNEIDAEVCWCGDFLKNHAYESHSPVPMGCTCGYVTEKEEEYILKINAEQMIKKHELRDKL